MPPVLDQAVEGFEHGAPFVETGGNNVYATIEGTATGLSYVTSPVHGAGGRALQVVMGSGARGVQIVIDHATSTAATAVISISIYVSSFSVTGANRPVLTFRSGTSLIGALYIDTAGNWRINSPSAVTGPAVTTGAWTRFDFKVTVNGTTATVDWQVNGSAQTQASGANTQTVITRLHIGSTLTWGADTGTIVYDDIGVSQTAGDYPIGDIEILPLKPSNLDIANSATPTDFQTNSGVDPVAGDYALLDDLPIDSGTSDWIGQDVTGSAKFIQVEFENPSGTPFGVQSTVLLTNDGSQNSTFQWRTRNSDGTEVSSGSVTQNPGTSGIGRKLMPAIPTGGWTNAELAALVIRFGYSGDVTPIPRFAALMLQYARAVGDSSTNWLADIGDSAPATDAVSVVLVSARDIADSAPATDAVTRVFTGSRDIADSAPATDAVTSAQASSRDIADSAPATDAVTRVFTGSRDIADSAPATDAPTTGFIGSRDVADTAPAIDSPDRVFVGSRDTADSAPATDTPVAFRSFFVDIADSAPATDAPTRAFVGSRDVADSAPATDAVTANRAYFIDIADSAPAADAPTRVLASVQAIADSAPATDAVTRVFTGSRDVADSAPATDSPDRVFIGSRVIADSAPATDVVARVFTGSRAVADTAPATDVTTQFQAHNRAIGDSAPATDAVSRSFTSHGRVVFRINTNFKAGARREVRGNTAPPPPGFLEAFMDATSYIYRRVDIYEEDGETPFVLNADFLDGSVSVDLSRAERRTFSLTLDNTTSLFHNYAGGFWYDKVVKIHRGIYYRDETWEVQLGEFLIDGISQDHFPHITSCNGRDYTKKLMTSKLRAATAFLAGSPMEEVIRTLALNGGITKFILPNTGVTLGKQFTFDRGTSRWDAIHEIVEAYGYEVYFNGQGYMVLREFQDPTFSPNQFVFFTGPGGQIASYSKVSSDTRIYNHIVVAGEAQDQPPVWAEAKNTNPNSPTSIDNLRQTRTYEYVSGFITTEAQAQDVADKFLKIHALEAFEINLETIVLPWLDVGNIIEFLDPDPNPGEPTRFLLSTMEIPLALQGMTFGAKRVTIVG